MANLKDIKRRIGSVKNTQKITHAMKLVSAAKFARANHAVLGARPYGIAFEEMAGRVVLAAGDVSTPLTVERGQYRKTLFVLIATDRGLCGSLNSNMFKFANRFVREKTEQGVQVDVITWGRRATSFARKMQWNMLADKEKVTEKPRYEAAKALASDLVERFLTENYDDVQVGFVEFKSAMSQIPSVKQVLPVRPVVKNSQEAIEAQRIILEPAPAEFLASIIKRQVEGTVFRILLEASASEQGSRMTAMDSATKNAKEVVRKLTLQYNRGRQAAITKELIEITSGAEAL